MSDDLSDIAAYYSAEPEKEHQRLENHQLEYELTWRFLEEYLPTSGHLLEIGSATGRYTLELAKRGYQIMAVDLSRQNIAFCRQLLTEAGLADRVQLLVGDARLLREVPKQVFDAILLMGPLYHLVEQPDREMALQAAYDRLRPGGIIFTAFISRHGIWGDLMKNIPEWIEELHDVRSHLEKGKAPASTFPLTEKMEGYWDNVVQAFEKRADQQREQLEQLYKKKMKKMESNYDRMKKKMQGAFEGK